MLGFSISDEGQPPDANGYYLFDADWSGRADGGSSHLAGVLVSEYDGDVWDGSTCERLKSKALLKAQQLLRQKLKSKGSDLSRHEPPRCAQ